MTAAQKLIEQGRAGTAATLQRLLSAKFGSLNKQHRALIQTAPVETLLTWIERVLTAESPNDVFHGEQMP